MNAKLLLLIGGAFLPFAAHAESYVVGLGYMEVFNGVCRGPNCTDTDYATLVVEGPNGQSWKNTFGPNELHKRNRTNWSLFSPPISVPANNQSALKISWVLVNKGHNGNAAAVKQAIDKGGDAYLQSRDQNKNSNTLATAIVEAIKSLADWFTQDCDSRLFDGGQTFDGATLAASGPPGYDKGVPSGEGSHGQVDYFHVFDYPPGSINTSCDGVIAHPG